MSDEDWGGFVDALVDLDRQLDEAFPGIWANVEERGREYQELLRIYRLRGRARKAAIREKARTSEREARAYRQLESQAVRELIRDGYDLERIAEESGLTLEVVRDLAPRTRWFRLSHLTVRQPKKETQ